MIRASALAMGGALLLGCGMAGAQDAAAASQSIVLSTPVRAGLVFLPVSIGSSGPFEAMLDSGASANVLDASMVSAFGTEKGMHAKATGAGGGAVGVQVYFDTLRVGSGPGTITINDAQTDVISLDSFSAQVGYHMRGIVGYRIFNGYTVEVDYQKQETTLTPAGLPANPPGQAVPIKVPHFLLWGLHAPTVKLTLAGPDGKQVMGTFEVDSGNSGVVQVKREFAEKHPGLFPNLGTAPVSSAVGMDGVNHAVATTLSSMDLGPFHFDEVAVGVTDSGVGSVDGLIGSDILKQFTVTWAYSEKKMYLRPNERYSVKSTSTSTSTSTSASTSTDTSTSTGDVQFDTGLEFISHLPDFSDLSVDKVVAGLAGEKAGLRAGDRIVSVDGKPLAIWQFEDYKANGAFVDFQVERAGETFEVKMGPPDAAKPDSAGLSSKPEDAAASSK